MTKFTITGASGLVGCQLVDLLTAEGHEVVAASRSTGVDVLTGEGLAAALAGADVLVDVTNSPSYEDDPVLAFFTTAIVDSAVPYSVVRATQFAEFASGIVASLMVGDEAVLAEETRFSFWLASR
jgi:nucleoside-diphosphate-sugar epimerase